MFFKCAFILLDSKHTICVIRTLLLWLTASFISKDPGRSKYCMIFWPPRLTCYETIWPLGHKSPYILSHSNYFVGLQTYQMSDEKSLFWLIAPFISKELGGSKYRTIFDPSKGQTVMRPYDLWVTNLHTYIYQVISPQCYFNVQSFCCTPDISDV